MDMDGVLAMLGFVPMEAVSGRCLDTLGELVAKRARLVLVLASLSAKLVAQVPVPGRDFIT